MSYQQPPPGLKSSSATSQPHPSLPARPAFKPAFPGGAPPNGPSKASPANGGFTAFKPRAVTATPSYSSPSISAPPSYSSNATSYGAPSYQQQPQPAYPSYPQQPQPYYPQASASADHYQPTPPPAIVNPFAPPGAAQSSSRYGDPGYDPEMEAQIAQWQSAYTAPSEAKSISTGGNANLQPLGSRGDTATPAPAVSTAPADPSKPTKTVIRSGGGDTWQDASLLEWDPAHFRLFVGNLAGEVTDESLLKAFSKYTSVQKARVIRDKRTTKSKGYGFVSFSDGDEFFLAARDMQGKYIGSHPVLLKRAVTDVRSTAPKDDKKKKWGKNKGKEGRDGHADTGAGVQKKMPKMKGGLKLLG